MINVDTYNYTSWNDVNQEVINFDYIPIYNKWKPFFEDLKERNLFQKIKNTIHDEIQAGYDIYPYPKLIFNAFNSCDIDKVKVVIIGQDPYPNADIINNKKIPQAMGLSFSVPVGIKIPVSLDNIFKNQINNEIIDKKPKHGNLQFWTSQGCLLLNSSLTVREREPNSHTNVWKPITERIIKYLSNELENLVFVLWGSPALEKIKLIDCDKHHVIISSHPSGLSCNSPLKNFPAFINVNHFQEINNFLINDNKQPIVWKLF
jgi:uracil-DNA glycosylase